MFVMIETKRYATFLAQNWMVGTIMDDYIVVWNVKTGAIEKLVTVQRSLATEFMAQIQSLVTETQTQLPPTSDLLVLEETKVYEENMIIVNKDQTPQEWKHPYLMALDEKVNLINTPAEVGQLLEEKFKTTVSDKDRIGAYISDGSKSWAFLYRPVITGSQGFLWSNTIMKAELLYVVRILSLPKPKPTFAQVAAAMKPAGKRKVVKLAKKSGEALVCLE